MIDKQRTQIDEFKEFINTLPVNNIANRRKKKETLVKEKESIEIKIAEAKAEIERRMKRINSFESEDTSELENKISACRMIYELSEFNTPFEKMHLDYYLYQLHRYYKEDFESVNSCIMKIIESFNKVGIWLTEDDFDLSKYVKEYLGALLNKRSDETISEIFDKIYWQCPEIISSIETNFERIYIKYAKQIAKHYDDRKSEFLKSHSVDELREKYISLSQELEDKELSSEYNIINKFKEKELLYADLDDNNISKRLYNIFVAIEPDSALLNQLEQSLIEYRTYLTYEYLLPTMKTKLNEKDSYKGQKATILKEINKLENNLLSLNKQQDKKPLFGLVNKKKKESLVFDINSTIKELQEKYNELEKANFNEIIYSKMTKDSTILEVLEAVAGNYLYFVTETKKKEEDVSVKDLSDKFEQLKKGLFTHKFIILSNIALLQEKDIKMILVDKYKLKKINIPDDLDLDKVNHLLNDIFYIKMREIIDESDVSLEELQFMMDAIKKGF